MTTIRASIDAMEGQYLCGWAIDTADPDHPCYISVVSSGDDVLAEGVASRYRRDLSALQYSHQNFSFRIKIPLSTQRLKYSVLINGASEPQLSFENGPGIFDGVCQAADGHLVGWVTERAARSEPPVVKAVDQDGRVIATGLSADDLEGEDRAFTPYQFRLEIPNWAFDNRTLRLSVFADEQLFTRCLCQLSLSGYLEVLNTEECAGWLHSAESPSRLFEFDVFLDDVCVGTVKCGVARSDLIAHHVGASRAGFHFQFPQNTSPLNKWLSLRFQGEAGALFDGPVMVMDRRALVKSARSLAELSQSEKLLSAEARAVLLRMTAAVVKEARERNYVKVLAPVKDQSSTTFRMNIIVPVYRDLDVTRACLQSVLKNRDTKLDRLIIVNDCSPDGGMAKMLQFFGSKENVLYVENPENLGFVQSVNRALTFCLSGDVLLLNSDTEVFGGSIDRLHRALRSAENIGTVTALSNSATIFSYPHPSLKNLTTSDGDAERLANLFATHNADVVVDVPTAHGFCMMIRQEVLARVGGFDVEFGRGYGEENDLCQRISDLGFRHVAACDVFVVHKESVSFGVEKINLLKRNLEVIHHRYPEYTETIMEFEREDSLRVVRRRIDRVRLSELEEPFLLSVESWFGGGSGKAAEEVNPYFCRDVDRILRLIAAEQGGVRIICDNPTLASNFGADEAQELYETLISLKIELVIVHQLLGFNSAFIKNLTSFFSVKRAVFYVHDFYAACQRVTFLNALGGFCSAAPVDVCARCVALGGQHPHSRTTDIDPTEHRRIFSEMLGNASSIIAPSNDTAGWLNKIFPEHFVKVSPHPSLSEVSRPINNGRARDRFVLLGAIGPHKGSVELVDIASHASLFYPQLQFVVVGYTDRDEQLRNLGNVTITGEYENFMLPDLIEKANSSAALFLNKWPETFSYTLSEVAAFGLVPIVPDLGAPAERVRDADFGIIYPLPFNANRLVELLSGYSKGLIGYGEGSPESLLPDPPNIGDIDLPLSFSFTRS